MEAAELDYVVQWAVAVETFIFPKGYLPSLHLVLKLSKICNLHASLSIKRLEVESCVACEVQL